MESGEPRSALAVEVGPAEIRAGFLAVVEGRHRFVGEGEAPFRTLSEADEAIVAACSQLEVAVGQKFVDGGQLSFGDGQGPVCTVSNSSSPIRVAVIATDRRGSTEVATRALDGVPAVASGVVSLDDRDLQSAEALAYRLAELAVMGSDALLVAGGSDKRDRVALRLAAELLGAMAPNAPEQGPWIVYAGPEQFRNEIEQALHGRLRLQTVPSIIPTAKEEHIQPAQDALMDIWRQRVLLPGLLSSALSQPVRWRGEAHTLVTRFLAATKIRQAVLVDLDPLAPGLYLSLPGGERVIGAVKESTQSDWGVTALLRDSEEWAAWAAMELDEAAQARFIDRRARPWRPVEDTTDFLLEGALVGLVVRRLAARPNSPLNLLSTALAPFTMLVTGPLARNAPTLGDAALLALDAAQPAGIGEVLLDDQNLVGRLGALAFAHPQMAAEALLVDGVLPLGTCFAPKGVGRPGKVALTLHIEYSEGTKVNMEVPFGQIETLPLPTGASARVVVSPAGGFDVGWGWGKRGTIEVQGGPLGIVVDARGRPVRLPKTPTERSQRRREWRRALGAAV